MSWKHWTAILAVIGVGIVLQIPRHDPAMEEHQHSTVDARPDGSPAVPQTREQEDGPYRTVALEVTGMT